MDKGTNTSPAACPVCGNDGINPVVRRAIVTVEGEPEAISGVLAYRCARGHLFINTASSQKRRLTIVERTTSEQTQHLEEQIGGQQRRDLLAIVGGRDFNQIAAHQVDSHQGSHQFERLCAG